jgi:NhaA family Na+:H+ antiporter
VAFGILPLFAFVNAGVSFAGMAPGNMLAPLPLGIAAGLFLGKQLGIVGFSWLGVRLGLASLPSGVRWLEFYGMAMLCGIGFTMSLFVASLAQENAGVEAFAGARLGVLAGSLLSALGGYLLLRFALRRSQRVVDGL